MLNNKKVFILGMARSGYNVAKLIANNNEVLITDIKEQDNKKIEELNNLNVKFVLSNNPEELLDDTYDLIIKNPGIEPTHPCLVKGRKLGIKIVNEMEVAYSYLKDNVKIIGITGSNGKTTTTTMIYDLLKLHGEDVYLGGNIGYPLSEIVRDVKDNSILVLEISDHQLYDLDSFKTDISILTNLCPTHLDYHGTYENYKNVKKKIFNHHTNNDLAIINKSNIDSVDLTNDIPSKKIYFNDELNYFDDSYIYIDGEKYLEINDIKIKGTHNYENVLCSIILLKQFNINKEIVVNYFKNFNGVEHRIEVVDNNRNIYCFNDSKSTNPTATLTALKTMKSPTHLILGGYERKQDFNEINSEMGIVKCIYAIGTVTDRVYEYAKDNNIECYKCYKLEDAILKIKENIKEGETILLSPASASWDQYDKFETRGEEFKNLVEKYFK